MGERLPHEAFATLGDESRIEIMRAIANAQATAATAEPAQVELAFSEIYDRVDVDGTSKLSYHLGELTGTFLRKLLVWWRYRGIEWRQRHSPREGEPVTTD